MTPNGRKRGGTDKSRKRRRPPTCNSGCTLTLLSTSEAAFVPCLASSSHECGTECITRSEYSGKIHGDGDRRVAMEWAHAIGRGRCCYFLTLLILVGTISSGECDDSSTNGPTMLRRRLSLSVPVPPEAPATIDQGETNPIVRQYLDNTNRNLIVPCETAECKKERRRRQRRKKKKAPAQNKKKREANQKRRQRRKKRNEKKQQLLSDGAQEVSKGLVSPKNDSSLPLLVEIDDNTTSAASDDTGADVTLPSDIGEVAVNKTTPTVPNATEESTKSKTNNDSGPPQPPLMGGISAKPQHRCAASIDDTITEDHCAQSDCLYDEETGLWDDENCPGDQVCVYAQLCVAKLPTFPGGMPEGLQLAPAGGGGGGGGGGGPSPGPLAASTSSGAAGRSSSLPMESTVAANHLRRPHAVLLDLEEHG